MGTHLIPRSDVKGQDRFFIIFTIPGLIGTLIGAGVALPFYGILAMMGMELAGYCVIAAIGAIGFVIGQVKIPDTNANALFRKVGGEYIRDIILRYIKFGKTKKKFVNEISTHQEFATRDERVEKVENYIMNKDENEG